MKKFAWMAFIACTALFACGDKKDKPADIGSPYIDQLKETAKNNPTSFQSRMTLIDALDSLGRYKEALPEIDQLIAQDSLNNILWLTKGKIQQNLADTAGAILSFHRSARIYPAPDALLALANLYAETRNSKVLEVCAALDQLKLGREMDSYTFFFTGVYYARTGDRQKALAFFDRSINSNYTLMDNYIEKGSLYYEANQYTEAINVLRTATNINNTFADAYYWQGKCYEAMGNKTEAESFYKKALVLDKQLKEAEEGLKRLK